jgi:hypothetical protein
MKSYPESNLDSHTGVVLYHDYCVWVYSAEAWTGIQIFFGGGVCHKYQFHELFLVSQNQGFHNIEIAYDFTAEFQYVCSFLKETVTRYFRPLFFFISWASIGPGLPPDIFSN